MLSAILLAAGRGVRLKSRLSKAVMRIKSKPVICYSLSVLDNHPAVDNIVIVANPGNIDRISRIVTSYRFKKVGKIVLGGRERKDSVLEGLKSLDPKTDYVLIHDAARIFIDRKIVTDCISAAKRHKAAVAAVPVKPTIKISGDGLWVRATLRRENLWEAQTPQVFEKELILRAYLRMGKEKATDDAMLVERLKREIRLVKGSYGNIKITTPEDIDFANVKLGKKRISLR